VNRRSLSLEQVHISSSQLPCHHRHHRKLAAYANRPVRVAIAACTPFPASANSQATRVMQAAIMSKGNVNYSGERIVEVYSGGQRLRVVRQRIHCKQGDKQRIETVEPSSEAGSLFVSNGLRIWEYTPQKREVVVRQMQTADSLRRHRSGLRTWSHHSFRCSTAGAKLSHPALYTKSSSATQQVGCCASAG